LTAQNGKPVIANVRFFAVFGGTDIRQGERELAVDKMNPEDVLPLSMNYFEAVTNTRAFWDLSNLGNCEKDLFRVAERRPSGRLSGSEGAQWREEYIPPRRNVGPWAERAGAPVRRSLVAKAEASQPVHPKMGVVTN
jgi:hypothetical protein